MTMAHSGTSSPTTGRPCNMVQPAANGTSLFNGTDASTAPLRYALRALASEPDFLAAPHQVIARLRPRVDAEKRRLAQGRDMPGSPDERLRNWARLVDGAISGLTYLARVSVDADARTVVAPFAVMAVGQYGARRCEPESTFELQYLLPDDQGSRERSGQIVAFMQIGLAEFGLRHRDAMSTVVECARAAHGDPAAAARLATARFLGGQYTLYVGFADRLGDPRAGCTDATRESRCSLGSARFRRSCRIQCHQSLAPDSTAGGGDGSASEGTGQ
jgi:UTP:GlnB (protein PII) uridylyltransferase